jgi:hypothetical protein
MRKIILILILLLTIGVLTFAQDIGPAIENQHAGLAYFTSVIDNPRFEDEPTLINVNGRNIEVPYAWSYTGFPEVGGLPPYVSRYDEPGYRFSWDWINGQAGFAQDGIQLYGNQRYAVRVEYRTDMAYSRDDLPFVPSDFKVFARMYTARGGMQALPAQSMQGLEQEQAIEWVIESTENPYPFVRLEVMFDVTWPIFVGNVYLQHIDIVTVPEDYRPEAVIGFE